MLLLLISGRLLLSEPFNDAGTIYYSAAEVVKTGHVSTVIDAHASCAWSTGTSNNDYFLIYPKSIFMVAYLLPAMKLASLLQIELYSSTGWYFAILLNCLHILASVFVGTCAVKQCRGKGAALFFLLLSLFFLPNYLNTYKVYSDTLSMPYISFGILFLLHAHRANGRESLLCFSLCGFSLAFAALLKGSALVFVIATVFWELLRKRSVPFGQILVRTILMLAVLGVVMAAWTQFIPHITWH